MKLTHALAALILGTALLLLSPIAMAAAAYAPKLVVTPAAPHSGIGSATVELLGATADDTTARSVVYLPLGYRARSVAPGVEVGLAHLTAVKTTGSVATLSGTVTGANPADYATNACAAAPVTVWLVTVKRSLVTITIPLLVAPAPAAATNFATSTITACWPVPGSAEAGGLRPLSLMFALDASALTTPSVSGTYRWRAQLTPFGTGSTTENAAGSVESQSLVLVPTALRLSAKLVVRRTPIQLKVTRTVNGRPVTVVENRVLVTRFAALKGTATEADAGLAGARVTVLGGSSPTRLRDLTAATADARGAFSTLIQINTTAKTVTFQAELVLAVRDRGASACVASFGATVPCISASSGKLSLSSTLVRLATGR